jgi:hypothetical protein
MTDDQLSLLDLPAARTARDDGIARVDDNSDDGWKEAVDDWIHLLARCGADFTVDDIRKVITREPHHDNAWGARFAAAARRGVIRRVGYRQSARPAGHARAVAVWRGVGT